MQFLTFACIAALGAAGCAPEPGVSDIRAEGPAAQRNELHLVNADWRIVKMGTAHGSLVIEVEAADPGDAREIARSLIEPLQDKYDEVLVYVAQLGDPSDVSPRRVQWTRRQGYVEGFGRD